MSGSNRPQVLGLVIITAATSGPSRAFSASRSTRPRGVGRDILDRDSRRRPRSPGWCRARFRAPARPARASPRASSAARMHSRPHSSPCAPALGLIATPCMPVRSSSQKAELVDQLERALHRLLRLQRVDVGEARQPRHLLVEARVVLHRARAEREQAEVDRVVLPATGGCSGAPPRARTGRAGRSARLRARPPRRVASPSAARRNRRRSARLSPISKISGSSSISARLPVTVCASPCSLRRARTAASLTD